jgi:hypothetical protein
MSAPGETIFPVDHFRLTVNCTAELPELAIGRIDTGNRLVAAKPEARRNAALTQVAEAESSPQSEQKSSTILNLPETFRRWTSFWEPCSPAMTDLPIPLKRARQLLK